MFVSCILVIERIASPVPFLQEALSSSLQFETLNWEAVKWTEILLAALHLWTLHYSIVDDSHSVFYFVVAKIFSFFCARSWCCMYHPSFTYQPRRRGQLQFTKSNVQHSNTQRFTYWSHQFIVGGAEFFFSEANGSSVVFPLLKLVNFPVHMVGLWASSTLSTHYLFQIHFVTSFQRHALLSYFQFSFAFKNLVFILYSIHACYTSHSSRPPFHLVKEKRSQK